MMKKRWRSAYALSFAIVLFYPLFTPPAVTLAQIESSFDLEQANELYELFFNLPHLHFQTNKVFSIQNLTADPDELYDYINLEVSSTPQFHSYILRKILEIQDKTVATTRFLEKDTEVLVKLVETDFIPGTPGVCLFQYRLFSGGGTLLCRRDFNLGKAGGAAVQLQRDRCA